MKPPFDLNSKILNLVSEISLLVGRYDCFQDQLRKAKNRKRVKIEDAA
jgi:hypothetical protein